jgi:endonuclease/exonuclease/phosphatase family metal-dependent hydrolase
MRNPSISLFLVITISLLQFTACLQAQSASSTDTQAGFTSGFENIPLSQRVTHPSKGRYSDATFDYIFVKGKKLRLNNPTIYKGKASDHLPVTVGVLP